MKRVLSLILALAMLLCVMPMSVCATDNTFLQSIGYESSIKGSTTDWEYDGSTQTLIFLSDCTITNKIDKANDLTIDLNGKK